MCFGNSGGSNNTKPAGYALADSHKQVQMSVNGKDVPKQTTTPTVATQSPMTSENSTITMPTGGEGGLNGGVM